MLLSKSVPQLTNAVSAAKAVIEDPNATERDVQSAIATLDNAITKLEPKPDKTKLNNLIEQAEGFSGEKYTTVSYNALQDILKTVKSVQNEPEATQQNVDDAIATLQDAIGSLKKSTSCVWEISVSLWRSATNHVGNDWSSGIYYGGENVGRSFEVTKKEGATITVTGKAVENDNSPDSGSGSATLTLKDGNGTAITFYVRENRGRYAGNYAVWELEVSCKLLERI